MAPTLQHNVDRTWELHTVRYSGERRRPVVSAGTSNNPDFRPTHAAFDFLWTNGRTLAARRITSEWAFANSSTRDTEGDVRVLAMGREGRKELQLRTVNAHLQRRGRERTYRPAERARWSGTSAEEPCILAAVLMLSPSWNPHCSWRSWSIPSGSVYSTTTQERD